MIVDPKAVQPWNEQNIGRIISYKPTGTWHVNVLRAESFCKSYQQINVLCGELWFGVHVFVFLIEKERTAEK